MCQIRAADAESAISLIVQGEIKTEAFGVKREPSVTSVMFDITAICEGP